MLVARDLSTESWRPDFGSSSQGSPTWTRLLFEGRELANSLEAPEWGENPVQVVVCDSCGFPQCAPGGYVHMSRTPGYVVWTLPQTHVDDDFERRQNAVSGSVHKSACILIPRAAWDTLSRPREWMPDSADLEPMTGRALLDGWRHGAPATARVERPEELVPLLTRQILACGTLTPREAVDRVSDLVEWLTSSLVQPVRGEFVSPEAVGATTETLYLDGPRTEEWVALALVGDHTMLAFSREWIFQPTAT